MAYDEKHTTSSAEHGGGIVMDVAAFPAQIQPTTTKLIGQLLQFT